MQCLGRYCGPHGCVATGAQAARAEQHYFHGGEMPGYNSFMSHDPANDLTLVIWTNLTLSLDGQPTANALMLKMLDRIYTVSPLQ